MPSSPRLTNFFSALLGAAVVAVLFGGLLLAGAFDRTTDATTTAAPLASTPASLPASSSSSTDASSAPAKSATDVSALYEKVRAGVVAVQTRTSQGGATGSGIVLDRNGYILTNDHVVSDANSVSVQFVKGGLVKAKVVDVDPSTDLALLKVDPSGQQLTPLALGTSNDLKVGQSAIALGSPFGLDGTLTTGVVSALNRTIQAPNNFQIDNVVQTDAAINPGNSGGPLLDAQGRVIGINAQIATDTQSNSGVGFAIGIDTAKQVIPQLMAGKKIERPYLGVSTQDPATGTGAVVAAIVRGGPADDAGLKVGDRIESVGGRAVKSSDDLANAVTLNKPGQSVPVKVTRSGSEHTISVKLGTRPATATG